MSPDTQSPAGVPLSSPATDFESRSTATASSWSDRIGGAMSSDASGCDGKERFRSYRRAEDIAGRQSQRHDGERFNIYHCKHCDGFHIGSVLKARRDNVTVATTAEWEELDFIEMRNRNRVPKN